MEKSQDRLKVIENIRSAIENGKLNSKVEEGDPFVSQEDREKVILNYDTKKKKIRNKVEYYFAKSLTDTITNSVNKETKIIGLENIENIDTGAIITSNHFSKVDSTIIRFMINKIHKSKDFGIIVQESNFFMPGVIGWLIRNNKTIPLSLDHNYMAKNFIPTVRELLNKKSFILIYPEEEMWFNYRKPRPPKPGAYHYAAKYNVPIIPCFVKIEDTEEYEDNGFKKSKYTLYIMKPIFPDTSKDLKQNKEEMREKDYNLKKEAYEKAYGKKLDYKFNPEEDIAGW
ncbi:MAG: lysophospholipid acyltransferase family protein [Clostridia bacterium]